jgi:hypothetical protein
MDLTTLHLLVLALTVIGILYADHLGWQYFRGRREILPRTPVHLVHYGVWVGLVGMIVTGILLTVPRFTYLSGEAVFYLKLAFVGWLVVNAVVIGRVSRLATTTPFRSLELSTQRLLVVSGVVSVVGWVGSALIGYVFL